MGSQTKLLHCCRKTSTQYVGSP